MRRVAAIAILAAMASCSRHDEERHASPTPAVVRVAEGPGVTLRAELMDGTIATSELATLRITAVAVEGTHVSPTEYAPPEGAPRPIEVAVAPARTRPDGSVERTWTYTLEPDLAGTYTLPPAQFAYRRARSGEVGFVATEPVEITVTSVLDDGDSREVTELRAVAAPPPPGGTFGEALTIAVSGSALGLVVIAAGIGAGVYWARRLRRRSGFPQARRAVTRLIEEVPNADARARTDAVARGARIVRECIRERTELPALSMTGEELAEACPELRDMDNIPRLLDEIERAVYAGAGLSAEEAASFLRGVDRAVDDLSTFVPTKYVDATGVPA